MTRLLVLLLLGGAGVLATPAVSSAQFGFRYGGGYNYGFGAPVFGPSNPFFGLPHFNYQYGQQYNFNTSLGSFSIGTRSYYSGIAPPVFLSGYNPYIPSVPIYQQGGSYMTGGAQVRPDLVQAAERAMVKAQREASVPDVRGQISDQNNYEKGITAASDAVIQPPPPDLRKALEAASPAEVVSGAALNELLKEIVRVEAKGAKGPAAYIPPLQMDDMRFAGPPAADLLNYARRAGNLPFPVAFDNPVLAALRPELERDFTAAAVAVQAGKAPEMAKVTKLEATFQRVQDAAGSVVKNLPFEDAAAARRFLNRMANAIKAMKGTTANGLIDPKWAAEGLTVADLVRHMTRHKLTFASSPRGSEEAYMAMHRNFGTYLFVLNAPKK